MTPSGAVAEILPQLQCKWLRVTLRSPSFCWKRVEITSQCAFWFICKLSYT